MTLKNVIQVSLSILILSFGLSCSKNNSSIEELLDSKQLLSAETIEVDESGLSKVRALIKTVKGNVEIKFYPKQAPHTVTRVLELIQKGFYDGLTFHRVLPSVLVQTGDPTGEGFGGSGIKIRAEINNILHTKGIVAMARKSGPDTADSQFYIALKSLPELDGKYTVFGKVTTGIEVLGQISKGDKIISISLIRPRTN